MFTLSSYPPITCAYRVLLSLCVFTLYVFLAYVPFLCSCVPFLCFLYLSFVAAFLVCLCMCVPCVCSFLFLYVPACICYCFCALLCLRVVRFCLFLFLVPLCRCLSFMCWCVFTVCSLPVSTVCLVLPFCLPLPCVFGVTLLFLSYASFCVWSFSV